MPLIPADYTYNNNTNNNNNNNNDNLYGAVTRPYRYKGASHTTNQQDMPWQTNKF